MKNLFNYEAICFAPTSIPTPTAAPAPAAPAAPAAAAATPPTPPAGAAQLFIQLLLLLLFFSFLPSLYFHFFFLQVTWDLEKELISTQDEHAVLP